MTLAGVTQSYSTPRRVILRNSIRSYAVTATFACSVVINLEMHPVICKFITKNISLEFFVSEMASGNLSAVLRSEIAAVRET